MAPPMCYSKAFIWKSMLHCSSSRRMWACFLRILSMSGNEGSNYVAKLISGCLSPTYFLPSSALRRLVLNASKNYLFTLPSSYAQSKRYPLYSLRHCINTPSFSNLSEQFRFNLRSTDSGIALITFYG